ncbi:MAG TPA: bifunctional alpha,alpha-trehalose-phosphate synthase (UDP-forming)/trehalose-phosphatase [Candidatus Saccharimonadales bacterium]
MAQVLIVSNRLPVSVKKEDGELRFSPSLGGLATGLSSYVDDRKNKWIGWPGIADDELTEEDRHIIVRELAKHNCSPVFLTQKQIDDFYNGYSNGILWPLFHNLPFSDKDTAKHARWWRAYRAVNEAFAEAVFEIAKPSSYIWVHDYQLLLLPEMLRAERPASNIGFFLHIPFPAAKTFTRVKEHKQLLKGVLGADLIGFHTQGYVQDFIATCGAVGLDHSGARIAEFPMGIDYQKYAKAGKTKVVKAAVKKYKKRYKGRKIIVAVDRLDPSKGLVERLEAYREFLARNIDLHGKVVFSMVAAPSRTDIPVYQKLSQRLDALAREINNTYGTDKWQPVDYMNEAQPFEVVTALFAVADIAFIAPLRDGMNLAAKEFIASNHHRGVLILSQTAGAADELKDAIIVNPRQPETLVAGLEEALAMSRRELRSRLRSMQWYLSNNTVQTWAKEFVDTLQQPLPMPATVKKIRTRALSRKLENNLLTDYRYARKRLLLLDYDGSLVPFHEDYKNTPPPATLTELLDKLSTDPKNDVVVVSGRSAADLEGWFGHLPLSLIAEHGAGIKKVGNKTWRTLDRSEARWKRVLTPVLEKYAALTPGARVEEKSHSLVWHYRASPPYYAQKYAVIIKRALKPILKNYGLQLFQGNKILEIKDPRISKGVAVDSWLKRDYDLIFALGDDFTDEELFEALPDTAYSIKIGRGLTAARFRLNSYQEVRKLLRKLAN